MNFDRVTKLKYGLIRIKSTMGLFWLLYEPMQMVVIEKPTTNTKKDIIFVRLDQIKKYENLGSAPNQNSTITLPHINHEMLNKKNKMQ
eukprot:UN01147